MNIIKKQIAYNRSARKKPIQYIVIHDTGNTGKGADALSHFNYFNGGNRNSSADFFVDCTQIMQINDYTKYYTWHCGDGKGKNGIANSNSIGIEICINADGNYQQAYNNAVELTKHLMKELNIPVENVVRHYDASLKNCPASMTGNNWDLWSEFKKRISESEDLTMTQYEELKAENAELRKQVDELSVKAGYYNYIDSNMPDSYKPTIQKLVDSGKLQGNENGELMLTTDMMRILTILDRCGVI